MSRTVDPGAPGHIYCWGGFGTDNKAAKIAPSREAFEAMPGSSAFTDVGPMSYDPLTGNFICHEGNLNMALSAAPRPGCAGVERLGSRILEIRIDRPRRL
jgi:hypothetical protein